MQIQFFFIRYSVLKNCVNWIAKLTIRKNEYWYGKKILTPSSHHIQKSTQKNLNVEVKGLKLFEENIVINLSELEWGNGFLDMNAKAAASKEKKR